MVDPIPIISRITSNKNCPEEIRMYFFKRKEKKNMIQLYAVYKIYFKYNYRG